MQPEPHYNVLALSISTLIPLIMGFLYYHPKVFGNAWMNANGFTQESLGKGPKPALYLLCLFTSFLLTFFFWAWVTGAGGVDQMQVTDPVDGHSFVTFKHGIFHGFVFTLTVLFPIFSSMAIFEKRSFKWAAVNIGYWSISAMLMCGILSAWR